jgi:ABC-type glycerol-3-phosphate transport system substrate-binding protein
MLPYTEGRTGIQSALAAVRRGGDKDMKATHRASPRRPIARLVALLMALLLVVAACGGDSTDDTTATTGSDGTAAPDDTTAPDDTADPGTGDPVELTVWFARDYTFPDEFASLLEEHNIRVSYDVRPGDTMLPTMLEMREAGEKLPDLIEDDSLTTPAYIQAGLYQPMTEQVAQFEAEDPELFGTVFPSVWDDGIFDGENWHAAWQSSYDVIYYNIQYLEEAGIELPFTSWWDIYDACTAIKANHPDMSHCFGTGGTSPDMMFYWLTNFGAPFDGAVPDLTSPEGVDMIRFMQAMFEGGLMNPAYVIGEQDESQGAWVSGDGAILQDGLNAGLDYMAAPGITYGETWATTFAPNHPEGSQMAVPRGWSIVAESEHPDEVGMVLRYIMDPVNGIPRYLEGSSTPRSSVIINSPEVIEAQPYFTDEIKEAFESVSAQIPPATNTLEVGAVLVQLREEVLVIGTDEAPEEIAARFQAELDALK